MHGLARCGLLAKFHYQSTVSGGGYIGSWLSAWINRAGLTSITTQLSREGEYTRPNPEPLEIQNLRRYLRPRPGFFSADSWTLHCSPRFSRMLLTLSITVRVVMRDGAQ
ncbi:MAG TPA: hypothetical protein VLR92_04860 [Blastocatellia bacterium]|nr:hypothetical protein [Blastocatellia bacterium]